MSNTGPQIEPEVLYTAQPDWLKRIRHKAWNIYRDFPMPDRKPHIWRYTDPALFEYSFNGDIHRKTREQNNGVPGNLKKAFDKGEISGFVYNGQGKSVFSRLSPELEKAGVTVGNLAAIVDERPGLVEPYIGQLISPEFGKYEALNLATWESGIVVYVPKNVLIDRPLHLFTRTPETGNFVARTIIVLDEGAALALIDEYTGGPDNVHKNYINVATETFGGTASQLRHLTVQNLNNGAHFYFTHRSTIENDAKAFTGIASFGGHTTKANYGTSLNGRGSESELEGFLLGEKRQHFDHHTVHRHNASNTLSNLKFKVVLKDRSRSAYTGKISIDNKAPFSEAYQENRNLLLSPKCRVESIPELEINQDEVRCSHGAAMGPPDADQLFYLRSRGLPEHEAVQLIVEGFMNDALQRVPAILREHLRAYINKRLMGGWTFE